MGDRDDLARLLAEANRPATAEQETPAWLWAADAILAAGWVPAAQPTVNRDALAGALCERHQQASPTRIPCAACSQDADEQVKRAAARLRDIEVAAVSGIPVEDTEWAAREVLDAAVGRHRDNKP